MNGAPPFSISQITTLPASFDDDLRIYREAGAVGVGIWEIKLPDGRDDESLEALKQSGLDSTNAVPAVPSIMPLPLPGPPDPAERVLAYCASLRRLAPFRPSAVVLLTGPGERRVVVDGLRAIADEARSLDLKIGLEPYQAESGGEWTIVSTIRDAVELIDEVEAGDAVGVLFDVWHLWNDPSLESDLAKYVDRVVGVHVCDVRAETRSFADRVLPGDGIADLPRVLGALDRSGWAGHYDLEIFSDNGTFSDAFPDSLWDVAPAELVRRGRDAFLASWERRV